MKIKLLLLTWHGGAGGVSKIVHDIALKLSKRPSFLVEVGYAKEGGLFANQLKKQGIRIKIFGMYSGFDILGAYSLLQYINKGSFDLVHLNYLTPLLKISVKLSKAKLLISNHIGIPEYQEKKFWLLYSLFQNFTRKFADFNTSVSTYCQDELIKFGFIEKDKTIVIPNGIDLNIFSPDNPISATFRHKTKFKYHVGTVRGLTPPHGVDHFVSMANHVIKKRIDVAFYIVGKGPLQKALEKKVAEYGIGDYIFFLGERSDIPSILKNLDVIIMPSLIETFGIAAIEAMAMGKTVLAYNVGALPEVIENRENGVIIPERNPYLLSLELCKVLDSPEDMKKYGINGIKKVVQNYDINRVTDLYIKLYEKILST